jgi:hypothetical protein
LAKETKAKFTGKLNKEPKNNKLLTKQSSRSLRSG